MRNGCAMRCTSLPYSRGVEGVHVIPQTHGLRCSVSTPETDLYRTFARDEGTFMLYERQDFPETITHSIGFAKTAQPAPNRPKSSYKNKTAEPFPALLFLFYGFFLGYFLNFFRPAPPNPSSPIPKRKRVAGSGTGELLPIQPLRLPAGPIP